MKHTKADEAGSFVAWGNGFRYQYEAPNNTLSIAHLERQKVFSRLKFDHHLSKDPLSYVSALDKTNQIKALMYSNNTTTNLADTMDMERVAAIIETTTKISRYAYELKMMEFERFAGHFCSDFALKTLRIKKFTARNQETLFFVGRIQTQNNNSVCVRGCSMPALMAALSDRTLRDLITMEFGHRFENSAQNLLNVSSKLSTLSRVLDDNFIPAKRLKSAGTPEAFEERAMNE
jgi:hypothetical protein